MHHTQSTKLIHPIDSTPTTSIYNTVLGICSEIRQRLPTSITNIDQPVKSSSAQHSHQLMYNNEIHSYNKLLAIIFHSLNAIENSIRGIDTQFNGFNSMLNAIANNKIPAIWLGVSYATTASLSCFVIDLFERIRYFEQVICNGFMSNIFWLSAFYFPSAIIANLKQAYSKRLNIEYDQICVSIQVTSYNSHECNGFKSLIEVN